MPASHILNKTNILLNETEACFRPLKIDKMLKKKNKKKKDKIPPHSFIIIILMPLNWNAKKTSSLFFVIFIIFIRVWPLKDFC